MADVLADCEKQLLTHARLKDHSRIPLAKTRPAGRRRVWKWAAAAAAFVLLLCGVFFGRAAMLYWNDRGEVEFANDPGWKSVTVLRDGQPVAELESVFLHPRIDLPPGRYTLKAGLSSVMDEIILWEVVDSNLNGSWRSKETRNASNECIVDVKRGRRVQVRAVTRMRSQNDLNRDLDQKDLQGDWIAESIEFQNRKLSPEDCRNCRLAIKGETARLSLPDGRIVDGKFSLDASRSPKEIDFYGTDSKWVRGIYQVSINTLTLAIGDIGRERPVAFLSGIDPGSKQMMVKLKRVSSADEGWVPLFNGKNLTGWKPFPADRTSWKVENGLLVGHGKPSHLFTERGDFHNFHLRMEARVKRVEKRGAFGIFVRTPFGDPGVLLSPYGKESLFRLHVPKAYDDKAPRPRAPSANLSRTSDGPLGSRSKSSSNLGPRHSRRRVADPRDHRGGQTPDDPVRCATRCRVRRLQIVRARIS